MPMPPFPVSESSPAPGPGHDSIQAAIEAADADGTRSILDLETVSTRYYDEDRQAYGTASPLPDDMLEEILGTSRPSTKQIEESLSDLIEDIGRGMGIYVIGYNGATPETILFAGYSYD